MKILPKKFLNLPRRQAGRKSYFINHILVSFFTSLSFTALIFVLSTAYLQPQKIYAQKGISPAQRGQVLGEKTLLAKLYLKGGGATPSQISYGTDIGFDPDGNGTADVKVTSAGNLDFTKKLTEDGNEILANIIATFDATCPIGWTAVTAYNGKFLRGEPTGNSGSLGTGGSNDAIVVSHTHTASSGGGSAHSHTGTAPSAGAHTHQEQYHSAGSGTVTTNQLLGTSKTTANYDGLIISGGAHTHTLSVNTESAHTHAITVVSQGSSETDANMPAYQEVIYCKKDVGADYAEWIKSQEKYSPGTVVSANPDSQEQIKITEKANDPTLLGVISTAPGWIIGKEAKDSLLLSLAGQVPVNVSTISGPIKPGDSLTSSAIPGTAMKATKPGPILGKALQEFDPQNGKGQTAVCPPNSPKDAKCGQITVFVDLSWYDPQVFFTSTGDLHIEGSQKEDLVLKDKDDNLITRIGAFADLAAAKIKAGLIQTKKLTVDDIDILEKLNQLSDKIASQQTEIDSLKKEIEELKNKYNN